MSTFPIVVDATQLFYRFFIIPGVTPDWVDARTVQTLQIEPGLYRFQIQSSNLTDFSFTVTSEGTVDYDPGFGAFLGGRGTSSLQLNGFEVTLDASALSGASGGGGVLLTVPLTNEDWIQHRSVRLLPQAGYMVQPGSGIIAALSFTLQRDGTFSYAPELDATQDGPLAGTGTSSLTFKGHSINVDASEVSQFLKEFHIWGLEPSRDGKANLVVLPAAGYALELDRGITDLGFSVGVTGTVTLDPGMTDLLEVVPGGNGAPPIIRVLRHQVFESPIYGSTYVKGAAFTRWLALADQKTADGASVQSFIGVPVDNVQDIVAAGRTFIVQRFERGVMIDVQGRNGPRVVYGAVAGRYRTLSEFEGVLGAPLADEGEAPGGGRSQTFEGGVIYWRADVGAHELHGLVLTRWSALGGPTGLLGYPITDEAALMQGRTAVGAVSRFEALPREGHEPTVGAIYWSAPTGAHEMFGPILTAWQTRFGGPGGPLGLPTGAPIPTPNGVGRVQTFEKGLVVWTPATGAVPVTGGIVLNLFSFSCDDDFNVQITVTSRFGNTIGPENKGRIPAEGEFSAGTETFPPRVILSFPKVTPDLVVSVDFLQAISERLIGRDARKGNVAPIVYNIDNLWRLTEANRSHHDGSFTAVLAMQHLEQQIDDSKPFRQQKFWPFANFGTSQLSWGQFEQTFRDIAEVDKHISIVPPRFHPLEIAVYEQVYRSLAAGGNCFGMVTEAMYALEKRSLFEEPIFSSGSYRHDGNKLVPDGAEPTRENAEAANAINVKMGYQIGSEAISWFLGKWAAGALHDPVRAFRESRAAFARGDWPLLTISDKDKFSQEGHAVMPYKWDPPDETPPLPGQLWTILVANPNSPAPAVPDLDDSCKITIDPIAQTWRMPVGQGEPPWSGSSEEGGRLLMMPYSLVSGRPNSPADLVATLVEALAIGSLIVIGGDGTEQITDSLGRTIFRTTPDGNRRVNIDPVTRIPDLALLPAHERYETPREIYAWRPGSASAATRLQHVLHGRGDYFWALISPSLSVSIAATGVTTGTGAATPPGDRFFIEQLGTADQAITHITAPDRGPRSLRMSASGWPGSDHSSAKWFELSNLVASPGHTLRAQVLNAGRSFSVHNDGPNATFDLSVHGGLNKDPLAVRRSVELPSGKAWRLEAADWSGKAADTPIDVSEMDKIGGPVLRQFRM
jgi:hypothetical protein